MHDIETKKIFEDAEKLIKKQQERIEELEFDNRILSKKYFFTKNTFYELADRSDERISQRDKLIRNLKSKSSMRLWMLIIAFSMNLAITSFFFLKGSYEEAAGASIILFILLAGYFVHEYNNQIYSDPYFIDLDVESKFREKAKNKNQGAS